MNGFFSVCPYELLGAMIYMSEKKGNETAMRTTLNT
jgi:hypothetical protein